ncbi:MAG: DUF3500 domain-containing protein [Opitutaceae bacterium]
MLRSLLRICSRSLVAWGLCAFSFIDAHERDLVAPMAEAVNAYLESLDPNQLARAQFSFDSDVRSDWHYVPKERKGLAWAAMSPEQKHLSKQAFVIAFSESGHTKAKGVISSERILWEQSDESEYRNPENYFVSVFGTPGGNQSWGLAIEGHHLSVNITVVDGTEIFVTPSFFGSNPDLHDRGPFEGKRPLAAEADQAITLLSMMDAAQASQARISKKSIKEILTRAKPRVKALENSGVAAADMTEPQREQLRALILEYVGRYRAPIADDDMQKIDAAGFDKIFFSYAGAMEGGKPMYYRVQGPTFLLEYANVQNKGNHSHSVWRDFENDFGYDALKHHIEEAH